MSWETWPPGLYRLSCWKLGVVEIWSCVELVAARLGAACRFRWLLQHRCRIGELSVPSYELRFSEERLAPGYCLVPVVVMSVCYLSSR